MKYSKLFIILLSSTLSTNALSNTHAELNSKEAPVNFDNHYPDMPNEISKSELDNFYDIRRLYIKYFNPIQSQKENYENAKKYFQKNSSIQ